ncbi:hypothetical protein D3C76_1734070 [compost metagenome]
MLLRTNHNGLAIKMVEYAPKRSPITMASENIRMDSPPSRNKKNAAIKTVNAV